MARLFEFTESDWQQLNKTWTAWWNGELKRPLVVLECIPDQNPDQESNPASSVASVAAASSASSASPAAQNSGSGKKTATPTAPSDTGAQQISLNHLYGHLTRYPLDVPAESIIKEISGTMEKIEYLGDGFPRWWPNFGAGTLAAFLGSPVEYKQESTWFHKADIPSLDKLVRTKKNNPEGIFKSPWLQRVDDLLNAAANHWGRHVVLGYPDIGGNLDVLASLMGTTELLMALMDEPEFVSQADEFINQAWVRYFNHTTNVIKNTAADNGEFACSSWMPLMAPGSTYPLQCDFSAMISPDQFADFVLHDLIECCEIIDYPFYHLDGPDALRHIDFLLNLDPLKGIQWVPGAGVKPAEEWPEVLTQIREAGKLCQVYTTPDGAEKICRDIGGEGFLFCIGSGGLPTIREGEECLERLSKIGAY